MLALLAALAAVTWPALDGPMANQRLRKAADKVRTSWTRARIEAMSTGRTLVFRWSLDSDRYIIESQAGPESVETMTSSNEGEFDESGGVATTESGPLSEESRRLPEDVRFVDGEVEFDTRATILCESTADPDVEPVDQAAEPILFFPDGTTSTAKLILENDYQRRIELSLRGLTGVVTVGDTYPVDDSIHRTPE